jgi:hypothetical protein
MKETRTKHTTGHSLKNTDIITVFEVKRFYEYELDEQD